MKLEFSRLFFFSKNTQISISWNSAQWEPSFSMQTHGRTGNEANSRFSQFCERALQKEEEEEKGGGWGEINTCFIFLRFYFHLCTTVNSPLQLQGTNLTTLISATVFREGPNPSTDTLLGPRGIMITLNKHVINNGIASQHVTAIFYQYMVVFLFNTVIYVFLL